MGIDKLSDPPEGSVGGDYLARTAALHGGESMKMGYIRAVFELIGGDNVLFDRILACSGGELYNLEKFEEVGRAHGKTEVADLCSVAENVGLQHENFDLCRQILLQYGHEGHEKLRQSQTAWKGHSDRLITFASVMIQYGYLAFDFLVGQVGVYAADQQKFDDVAHGLFDVYSSYGELGVAALRNAKMAYGNSVRRYQEVVKLILAHEPSFADFLPRIQFVYGEDDDCFSEIIERTVRLYERYKMVCKVLFDLRLYYGKNRERFYAVLDCVESFVDVGERDSLDVLVASAPVYGTHTQKFEFVAKLIEEKKYMVCEALAGIANVGSFTMKDLERAVQYAASVEYDPYVLNKFIDIHKRSGLEPAVAYREGLKEKAKGLISSEVPHSLRAHPEYMFYVKYVFPRGDYSTHERNLACGDHLHHLQGYKYKKEGYPVTLTGVCGYKIKERQEENLVLMGDYDRRLEALRAFIGGRSPGNKVLAQDFQMRVEEMFAAKADRRFQSIAGLSVHQKMAAIFLTDAAKKEQARRDDKKYRSDAEVFDLPLLYHYVHRQNIETHAARMDAEIKTQGNEIKRHYFIWRELSAIYGESVQHVLHHDILAPSADGTSPLAKLEPVFAELMNESMEEEITERQKDNIRNTFKHEHIPLQKKPDVLRKQVRTIFGTNLRFATTQHSDQFYATMDNILQPCAGDHFTEEFFFAHCFPQLASLRARYRFTAEQKLKDICMTDVQRVNTELAKYQEMKEFERAGVEKTEKKLKERHLVGYFTKTKETANARMGAFICIAGDQKMVRAVDYLEFVMKDQDTGQCCGLTMLKIVRTTDGCTYMFFGPNPFESLLDQVSSAQCYQYMYQTAAEFADMNDFEGIFVPEEEERIFRACTNRAGDFPNFIKLSRIRGKNGKLEIVRFDPGFTLGYYEDQPFEYQSGALIWNKKNRGRRKYWASDQV